MYFERGARMNVGKNIAKFRKEKELNQEELAQKKLVLKQ